jgi:hypothetical protein
VIEALHIPLYEALRAPTRLGIAALMGMALASALAFAEVVSLLDSRLRSVGLRSALPAARVALFGAVVLASYAGYRVQATQTELPWLQGSYPVIPAPAVERADSTIARILREPGGPLLELPVGGKPFPERDHLFAMLRALDHGRPILNGYHGYWPSEFPARMALACRLPDPESLDALRKDTGLEYILVDLDRIDTRSARPRPYYCPPVPGDRPDAQGPSSDAARWQAVLGSGRHDLMLAAVEGKRLLFRVSGQP